MVTPGGATCSLAAIPQVRIKPPNDKRNQVRLVDRVMGHSKHASLRLTNST
jgi:hypothetical protein